MWAPPDASGHSVGFDEYAAAAQVIDHLDALGHRRVGYIGGRTADSERARRRHNDLSLAIAKRGLALHEDAIEETQHGFREGFDAMNAIAHRRAPVTAVVCGSDYLTAGALAALGRAGIDVPGRLSVASFNDTDFAPFLHPPLTTVRLPIRLIGEQAGHQLLAQLCGAPAQSFMPLPVTLMQRASTGPAAE